MKIIELTETQFKNYSKLHSSRNYYQTVEYAHSNKGTIYYLGYINENDNTLMAAVLLLERSLGKIKFGYVPGSFLVDYNNDNLFKDFITSLKDYLKKKKYIYVTTDNISTYKMFDKTGDVVYYDTNIIKLFDELGIDYDEDVAMDIMLKNLVCSDFFKWNFEEWRPYTEEELKKLKKK